MSGARRFAQLLRAKMLRHRLSWLEIDREAAFERWRNSGWSDCKAANEFTRLFESCNALHREALHLERGGPPL